MEKYFYLTSNQKLDIKFLQQLIKDVSKQKITMRVIDAFQMYIKADAKFIETLEVLLPTLHDAIDSPCSVLITYREHRLGSLAGKLAAKKQVYSLVHLGEFILQLLIEKDSQLHAFIKSEFIDVPRETFITAKMFLLCSLNATQASQKLYIHRNTFHYRLQKFIDHTGLDIRDHFNALYFTLADKIITYK
jgi:hypothetical protein